MSRKVFSETGHNLAVTKIDRKDLPKHLTNDTKAYTTFYVVQNWDTNGRVFLYLGKGHDVAPNEIVAWYPRTGSFWASYGKNIKAAIDGAMADAWMVA